MDKKPSDPLKLKGPNKMGVYWFVWPNGSTSQATDDQVIAWQQDQSLRRIADSMENIHDCLNRMALLLKLKEE